MMNKTTNLGNGSHRTPAYFEWWYFHFVTEDGTAVNMVVHETDIFGRTQKPYISLSLFVPGQPPRYLRRELQDVQIGQQTTLLHLSDGLISENSDCIQFHISFPGQGCFSGEIRKLAPPLCIADGILSQDANTGRASHWQVAVPHATFTAVLHLQGGDLHHLTGMAYQDHQWGSLLLQDFVSDWVWGHFSNEQMAVVFFQILTQNGRVVERIGLMLEQGRFINTALPTAYLPPLLHRHNLEQWQSTVEVGVFEELASLSFTVEPAQIMRCRLQESFDQVQASYLRWAATATYRAGQKQVPLYGITEYMRIRPMVDA